MGFCRSSQAVALPWKSTKDYSESTERPGFQVWRCANGPISPIHIPPFVSPLYLCYSSYFISHLFPFQSPFIHDICWGFPPPLLFLSDEDQEVRWFHSPGGRTLQTKCFLCLGLLFLVLFVWEAMGEWDPMDFSLKGLMKWLLVFGRRTEMKFPSSGSRNYNLLC